MGLVSRRAARLARRCLLGADHGRQLNLLLLARHFVATLREHVFALDFIHTEQPLAIVLVLVYAFERIRIRLHVVFSLGILVVGQIREKCRALVVRPRRIVLRRRIFAHERDQLVVQSVFRHAPSDVSRDADAGEAPSWTRGATCGWSRRPAARPCITTWDLATEPHRMADDIPLVVDNGTGVCMRC